MSRARNIRSLPAFTIIELLIVIVIIAILLVILVPALMTRTPDRVGPVRVVQSLMGALEAYHVTYGVYPPSRVPSTGYPNGGAVTTGAQALYYFLHGPRGRGWGPDPQDGGIVMAGKTWQPPDGLRGDWRSSDTTKPHYYVDGLGDHGKPILYYRANLKPRTNAVQDVYDRNENAVFWSPTENEWRALLQDPAAPGTAVNKQSYILIAPGHDREYGLGVIVGGIVMFMPLVTLIQSASSN